jgi:hypothetical protein
MAGQPGNRASQLLTGLAVHLCLRTGKTAKRQPMKRMHYVLLVVGGLWLGAAVSLPAQSYTFGTLAGYPFILDKYGDPAGGYADGMNGAARFNLPNGIAADGAGNVFVADTINNTIRKLTPQGRNWIVTTVAGSELANSGNNDGTNGQARFNIPQGVAVDNEGNLYVADTFNFTIRRIRPVGSNWVVSTIAGQAGTSGSSDGAGSAAQFSAPISVAVDSAMNVYVADYIAHTVRKISPDGTNWVVSTIAGAYMQQGSDDGTNNLARFRYPGGLATDLAGRVYVSDWRNGTIRMITPAGSNYVVTTIAGQAGQDGWVDGPGSTARFTRPLGGIAMDSDGKLYVSDAGMIRKLTPAGADWTVTTVAGAYGQTGTADGTGSTARFYWPQAMATDGAGNVYVADSNNHTIRIGMPSSDAPPLLQIAREENQNTAFWPLSAAGFVLDARTSLTAGVDWTPQPNGVFIAGSSFVLTNHIGAANAFYRLRLP